MFTSSLFFTHKHTHTQIKLSNEKKQKKQNNFPMNLKLSKLESEFVLVRVCV